MVRVCNIISASLGLLLLTQCNSKRDGNSAAQSLLPSTKTQSENQLTGEWKYRISIWYSSELTLEDNGTFKFHDQGCYGQKFSQGKWINDNGIIQLTSFDTFKPKEQADTNKLAEVIDQKKTKRKLKKGESEYLFVGFKNVQPPVLPAPNDTVRVYLDKIQLQLKNDTLYCVSPHNFPEEARFHRNNNNR